MGGSISLSDGATIRVAQSGQGRPVVLLHGWGIGQEAFAAAHDYLAGDARVITFDQRGHGPSGKAPLTIEQLSDDLADILDAMQLRDVLLVGWSMGAMVAWGALRHPSLRDRVSAMVSVDMTPRVTNDASWQLGFADGRSAATTLAALDVIRHDWPSMIRFLGHRIYAAGFEQDEAVQSQIVAPLHHRDPDVLAALWESMAMQDMRWLVPTLPTPTLLVHGANSQLYHLETGRYLKQVMPHTELLVMSGVGHAPHLEAPQAFYEALNAFHRKTACQDKSLAQIGTVSHR